MTKEVLRLQRESKKKKVEADSLSSLEALIQAAFLEQIGSEKSYAITHFSNNQSGQEFIYEKEGKTCTVQFVQEIFDEELFANRELSKSGVFQIEVSSGSSKRVYALRVNEIQDFIATISKDFFSLAKEILLMLRKSSSEKQYLIEDALFLLKVFLDTSFFPVSTEVFSRKKYVKDEKYIFLDSNIHKYSYPYTVSPVFLGLLVKKSAGIVVNLFGFSEEEDFKFLHDLNNLPADNAQDFSYPSQRKFALKKAGILKEALNDREFEGKMEVASREDNILEVLVEFFKAFEGGDFENFSIFRYYRNFDERPGDNALRTVIGEKRNGKIHELVTIIELSKEERSKQGVDYVLKWKGDPDKGDGVLERKEKIEKHKGDIDLQSFLERIQEETGKQAEVVGQFRKQKINFIIEDKKHHVYAFSIDETTHLSSNKKMRQIEIEYIYSFGDEIATAEEIKRSIENCMKEIESSVLGEKYKVKITKKRKIDFIFTN